MILTVDIGNTNIVVGGYEQQKPHCFITRMATDHHREADQYATELDGIFQLYGVPTSCIEGAIISSVVPGATLTMQRALAHFTSSQPLLLALEDAGSLVVDIEHPPELGMDLLASAIAVYQSHPLPAIIIDMGTATKLIAIDKAGVLRGVSISPGLLISLEALVGNASLLRSIALDAAPKAIGRNSSQSMQSGVLLGTACMLDGMIDRMAEEMGDSVSVVATGGASHMVLPYCRHTIKYSETLVLDGLYKAYCARQK